MKAAAALARAEEKLDEFDDPAVVLARADHDRLAAWAEQIDARPAEEVPLRGLCFGVKDNIDMAGLPTTVACPAFAYVADQDAAVVTRLLDAGALPVAKLNLDQFATGLVGTRSPYGTPRNPFDPALVPGGSSSGSAVAVARELVDFALGTDTAGSGRVPAATCGIVGVKPSVGWLSNTGVVPAVRSIDCVSVFSRDVATGWLATNAAAGYDPADPFSRRRPDSATPPIRRLGVLADHELSRLAMEPDRIAEYAAIRKLLEHAGFELTEVQPGYLFEIGDQLYGGPWVSERLVTAGALVDQPELLDPAVAMILDRARRHSALDVHRAHYAVAACQQAVAEMFTTIDALAFPTVPGLPTLADVAADLLGVNTRLGRFTTFTNLADLAAITVPLGEPAAPGLPPPSVSLHAPAWSDLALADVGALLTGEPPIQHVPDGWIELVVAGAHLRGLPLQHQLVDRGARFAGSTATAPAYRMYALADATPPKPAVVRVGSGGASLEVDVWALAPDAFGSFVAAVPGPLAIGKVELFDGRVLPGFVAEPRALDGADDITEFGGWRAYLASR